MRFLKSNGGIVRVFSMLILLCAVLGAATKKTHHAKPVRASATSSRAGSRKVAVKAPTHAPASLSTAQLAPLAEGIEQFEQKNYTAAIPSLARARTQVTQLGDYGTYYLAAAQDAQGEPVAALETLGDLAIFRDMRSPLLAKAVVIAARERLKSGHGNADELKVSTAKLREEDAALPQPEGDYALALAYDATGEAVVAATYYQRVYFLYPATTMAADASTALERLKHSLGTTYPAARPELYLERGEGWIKAKEFGKARVEFDALAGQLTGLERDQARVRVGAAQLAGGDYRGAHSYLQSLKVDSDEADAERWYYLEECARRMDRDDDMMDAIKELARHHERSVWRLKALVSAGNRYLMTNQAAKYEPLYRAAWETFPSDSATAYCHWKITWDAYLANHKDAQNLLKEQVQHYPGDNKAGTALYYLGRMAERDNDPAAARAYYERLDKEFPNFYYAVLAREHLTQSTIASATPADKVTAWLDTLDFPSHADYTSQTPSDATKARIERTRLLVAAGRSDLADSEVRFAAKTDGQAHLLAVELARTDAAPYLSLRHMKALAPDYLSTAVDAAPKPFWEMLFPLPYEGALVASSRRQNIDPFMVAALIRQESEFNPGAHSYANAYGLTQIVPATGRMLAQHQGMHWYSPDMLYQPETNLRLGTSYIRELLDQWSGHWEQTLASYNAGASRVKEWLSWYNYREPAEFVESIPITQTREYVQAVIRNAAVYRQVYGNSDKLQAGNDEIPAFVPAQKAGSMAPIKRVAAHRVIKHKKRNT